MEKKDVIKLVKEKGVKFIQLWFADILGSLKSFTITERELEGALESGKGFDGSSITGYAEAEESDIIAMPDPSTFRILPWEGSTGRMFCDILNPDRSPYPGDPRYVLKRTLKRASELGFTFYLGPELEYFYFKNSNSPEVLDEGGYFDLTAVDLANNVRKQTVETLEAMGIPVECDHHEVAPSQHEIDLQFAEALTMADRAMTYRMVVKEIAQRSGIYATFMPKPLFGLCGSGMHTHQSLFKDGKNAFFDPKDKYHLSKIAKGFIAGQLKHAREICSILAQWVNSYKRLVPGFEAPVYISWDQRNRTALIRVPLDKPGKEEAMRAELRCPDPACNPYLAFAVMLAAGLEGIEKGYKCPDPVEPNIYKMEASEKKDIGLEALPVNLFEAISEAERSELVRRTLGDHVFTRFIYNKKNEWNEDRVQVTSHEIKRYFSIL
ncbi:glutamine synthetase family protein [candidate division NPL-UPA2 bacterium]|nr:glutamine synthetase family protein [candidate division NPL-UPA2 bacterium]